MLTSEQIDKINLPPPNTAHGFVVGNLASQIAERAKFSGKLPTLEELNSSVLTTAVRVLGAKPDRLYDMATAKAIRDGLISPSCFDALEEPLSPDEVPLFAAVAAMGLNRPNS
jgi:hypothetical protein